MKFLLNIIYIHSGRAVQGVAYESFTCDDFPKPYIIQQPETQKGLRGENLTLFCRAASTSPANMTFLWQLDSNILEDVRNDVNCTRNTNRCVQNIAHSFDGKGREITSQLHLKNLTYDDAGKYQCLVYNDFGRTYSEKADITVYVYPKYEKLITPEKGAALFWYDLLSDGMRDLKSMHGGCPVLKGSKWILNKWLYMYDNFNKFPCRLQPKMRYNPPSRKNYF